MPDLADPHTANWIVAGFLILCGLAYIATCVVYSVVVLVAAIRERRDNARDAKREAETLALANEDRPTPTDLMPLIGLHADSLPADMRMEK